jgi:hypothetical protein
MGFGGTSSPGRAIELVHQAPGVVMSPHIVAACFVWAGSLLGLLSYAWLTGLAFKRGTWWRVLLITLFPVAGFVYVFAETNKGPFYLFCVAIVLSCVGGLFLEF